MPRQLLVRIAPFWILLVVVGSLMPGAAKHAIGTSSRPCHRLYHFAAFGSAALLLVLIAVGAARRFGAALAVIALAAALEFLQHRIYGSPLEWWDIRDDSYAALAAWLLGSLPALRRLLFRRPSPLPDPAL